MIPELPAVPPFRLRNHQLAQVICQVQFSPVLRIAEQEYAASFQDRVRRRYPEFMREVGFGILVTPDGISQQPQQQPTYRFAEAEGDVMLVLGTNFVAIEARSYTDIEDLEERIVEGVHLVGELFTPPQVNRIGLRFINEFRFTADALPGALADAFHPSLLGLASVPELRGAISESHAATRFTAGGNQLLVQHGLRPEGTTVMPMPGSKPPTVAADPFYLLDVDAYTDQPFRFDAGAVGERVRAFNDQGRAFFAWAVQSGYRRRVLGEEPAR